MAIRWQRFKLKYRFSDVEIKHLSIATALFTAVMVSLFFGESLFFMLGLAIITAPLFFLHEIGHKVSAQHYNLWAEFRLNEQMAMLTALSIILPFKFIGPGAVMVRANSYADIPKMGKISAFGPNVNILIGGIYLILTGIFFNAVIFISDSFLELFLLFFYASGFSYFLAIFNMIPFGALDGKKVKYWNNNAFWIFFTISGLFALDSFVYGIMFGEGYFLLGSILAGYVPEIILIYPIIIGLISILLALNLFKKLKDPYWEPGQNYSKHIEETYTQSYQSTPEIRINKRKTTSSTPMNVPCHECGKRELLPFKCSTCQNLYCAEHRLPGRHFCAIDAESY